MSRGERTRRRGLPSALLAGMVLALAAAAHGGAQAATAKEPQMRFDKGMKVETACFTVTNPSGGRSTLYGQRYTDAPVSALTPAIVLVHGIASSTANWDFSPTWSVARALASKGYVVFSYDRLGYARSPYFDHPGGGYTLTTSAHRDELHDVVGEVKSGGYTTGPLGSDCSTATQPSTMQNRLVVIIGHSAGGWIVAGYPGKYHDVAAMIQTDISGSLSPPNSPFGSSSGGGFDPNPDHPDYFDFFHAREECEAFNIYPPGAVQYVVDIACTPPFIPSPFGEIADLGEKYAENDLWISLIGPTIPVLLTSGDHDTTAPPDVARSDYDYYRTHCGCDVTQWFNPDSGHLFMAHRSLTQWVDVVVNWLTSRGVPPAG
jgi:pimeloyl-ACP methyl ester carboxylesterase